MGSAYLGSLGAGYGGWAAGYAGNGYVGYGGHGVAVRGPKTVPAVIEGPAGKIAADGLYGVPYHHYWLFGDFITNVTRFKCTIKYLY